MSELWMYVGEGIEVHFVMFLSRESVPRVGEVDGRETIYWQIGKDKKVVVLAANRRSIGEIV